MWYDIHSVVHTVLLKGRHWQVSTTKSYSLAATSHLSALLLTQPFGRNFCYNFALEQRKKNDKNIIFQEGATLKCGCIYRCPVISIGNHMLGSFVQGRNISFMFKLVIQIHCFDWQKAAWFESDFSVSNTINNRHFANVAAPIVIPIDTSLPKM